MILERQIENVKFFMYAKGYTFEIIKELMQDDIK